MNHGLIERVVNFHKEAEGCYLDGSEESLRRAHKAADKMFFWFNVYLVIFGIIVISVGSYYCN